MGKKSSKVGEKQKKRECKRIEVDIERRQHEKTR